MNSARKFKANLINWQISLISSAIYGEGAVWMDKRSILKQFFGHDAFRGGQEQLIDAILERRDVLGIMPRAAASRSVTRFRP